MSSRQAPLLRPDLPADERVARAFVHLFEARVLSLVISGTVSPAFLKKLWRGSGVRGLPADAPAEVYGHVASKLALRMPDFGLPLAEALHDRLAWDREPDSPEEWERLAGERPLEALWMAALSSAKAVRKDFRRFAGRCVAAHRASASSKPPSWEYLDLAFELAAANASQLEAEGERADEAERRAEAERGKLETLREELRRLRRENSEARQERAEALRRAAAAEGEARAAAHNLGERGIGEMERRLRRAEKDRDAAVHELERLRSADGAKPPSRPPPADVVAPPDVPVSGSVPEASWDDSNPRGRVLRQILRRLIKKGKIGASHTHADNVYRGVPDHDKGIAKEAIELLQREGLMTIKRTAKDHHVSIDPERLPEVRAIVVGEVTNPHLARWLEG